MEANTKHKELKNWVKDMATMCKPDQVVWCDGDAEENDRLKREAIASG